jgi:hypothetical protein
MIEFFPTSFSLTYALNVERQIAYSGIHQVRTAMGLKEEEVAV